MPSRARNEQVGQEDFHPHPLRNRTRGAERWYTPSFNDRHRGKISCTTFWNRLCNTTLNDDQKRQAMRAIAPLISQLLIESARKGHIIRALKYKNMMYEGGVYEVFPMESYECSEGVQSRVLQLQKEVSDARALVRHLRAEADKLRENKESCASTNRPDNERLSCSICFESLAPGDCIATLPTQCQSFYCLQCMETYAEYQRRMGSAISCPCCRAQTTSFITLTYSPGHDTRQSPTLASANADSTDEEATALHSVPSCDNCQAPMVERTNKYGRKFYGCPNWGKLRCKSKPFSARSPKKT